MFEGRQVEQDVDTLTQAVDDGVTVFLAAYAA